MFSKVLVNLTGVFLILYISATSATPIGDSEVQNIKNDIDPRAVRRPPYYPYQCEYPYAWMRRECLGAVSPRAWQDVCGITNYNNNFQTQYDNKPGTCPDDTYCLNGFNAAGRRFISCVSNKKGEGKRPADPQWGASPSKRARTQLANTQLEFSVKIDHDITGAAVAAVIQSEDDDFLIAPNNVIVGNVHGFQEKVCSGNKSSPAQARECYPNGTYNFKAGQTIDFTWGMTNDQEGTLLYGIVPQNSVPAQP